MQLKDLQGKLVLFKFSDDIRPSLPLFQIYTDELWAVVSGIDDVGIWIENPKYDLGIWWDKNGNLIPQQEQKQEKFRANILIPWRYIKALMNVDDERFQKIKSDNLPGFKTYR